MKRVTRKLAVFLCSASLLMLQASSSWATGTCGAAGKSGTSPYAADSNSHADISACLNVVESGSTIDVPDGSGSATWGSLTFPDNKTLHLAGPGRDRLTILGTDSIRFGKSDSKLTGFTFNGMTITSSGRGFVVGECHFEYSANTNAVFITGLYDGGDRSTVQRPRGLVYDCGFVNGRVLVRGTAAMWSDDGGTVQNYLMSEIHNPIADIIGTAGSVYVEDCVFHRDGGNWIDTNYGGGYVARFNEIHGTSNSETHGVQSANRANRWVELYHNRKVGGQTRWTANFLRGGTGVVFSNKATDYTRTYVTMDMQRLETTGVVGACDGTKVWDGNEVTSGSGAGWPCLDQIGTAGDATFRGTSMLNSAPVIKIPKYLWDNADDSVVISMGAEWVQHNRDYFNSLGQGPQSSPSSPFDGTSGVGFGVLANRPSTCSPGVGYWASDQGTWNKMPGGEQGVLYVCAGSNTWAMHYVPYEYPHPARQYITPSPRQPSAPENLRVVE